MRESQRLQLLSDKELIEEYLSAADSAKPELLNEYRRRGWLNKRMQTTAKYRKAAFPERGVR